MTANVDMLLARLDKVRRAGEGWAACCPAHQDRSASLSIGTGRDGRILLNCFAGCPALEVVQAIGLQLSDLFPERIRPETPEERRQARLNARQYQFAAALPVLEFESRIVLIAAAVIRRGGEPDEGDLQRLEDAVERIEAIRQTLNAADVRRMLQDLARAGEKAVAA